jgi:hypothetical protein
MFLVQRLDGHEDFCGGCLEAVKRGCDGIKLPASIASGILDLADSCLNCLVIYDETNGEDIGVAWVEMNANRNGSAPFTFFRSKVKDVEYAVRRNCKYFRVGWES